MSNVFMKAWTDVVQPILQRPNRVQVAALCHRVIDGEKKVLLITSRGTGRWILPKGWPMDGMTASGAAMQEAWEEAGVKDGHVNPQALGSFDFEKELDTGGTVICTAEVFGVEVEKLTDSFPEADQRTRKWVTPEDAATMVDEPGLQEIFRSL